MKVLALKDPLRHIWQTGQIVKIKRNYKFSNLKIIKFLKF